MNEPAPLIPLRPQWFFETPVLPEAIIDPYDPPTPPLLRLVTSETAIPQPPPQSPPSRNSLAMLEWVTFRVAETLAGIRPPTQLEQWLSVNTCRRLRIASRNGGWGEPSKAKITGVNESDTVIEAVAHLSRWNRTVAAAVRLESHQGRWRCTNFDLLLPANF